MNFNNNDEVYAVEDIQSLLDCFEANSPLLYPVSVEAIQSDYYGPTKCVPKGQSNS